VLPADNVYYRGIISRHRPPTAGHVILHGAGTDEPRKGDNMQGQAIAIRDAAERVGLHLNTLRQWVTRFPQIRATRDSMGQIRIGPDGLDMIARIKGLRAEGWPLDDIATMLADDSQAEGAREASQLDATPMVDRLIEALQPALVSVIREDHDRATALATAAREVGRLEERTQHLEATIERMREEIESLREEASRPWYARIFQGHRRPTDATR